jgi:hypothetical protein
MCYKAGKGRILNGIYDLYAVRAFKRYALAALL